MIFVPLKLGNWHTLAWQLSPCTIHECWRRALSVLFLPSKLQCFGAVNMSSASCTCEPEIRRAAHSSGRFHALLTPVLRLLPAVRSCRHSTSGTCSFITRTCGKRRERQLAGSKGASIDRTLKHPSTGLN